MSLPIFCPAQTTQPLDQLPPRRWQTQWFSKRWPPSKTICPETQRLLGGTSLKLAFRQTGAQRLAGDISTGNFRPVVPLKFRKNIFDHFHNVAHLGGSPPVVLFHLGLCGAVFPAMSPPVPAGVWPARGARSTATDAWSPSPSPSLNGVFLTCMLIWWAHCSTVIVLTNFYHYLNVQVDGSHPPFRNVHSSMRKSFNFYLDFSFWSAQNNHF
jgi:hypothetical protein